MYGSSLVAVSCASPTACTAVGSYGSKPYQEGVAPLAEEWNGSHWTAQPVPEPMDTYTASLSAVSCSGPAACLAVGTYTGDGRSGLLAENWNGSTWTSESTPPTSDEYASLTGVSCTAPTACTAVGISVSDDDIEEPLAEFWNGTAWTVQTTPTPMGSAGSSLDAVSCTLATACTAVGSSATDNSVEPLAETRNGTTWSVQATPAVAGLDAYLNGVSCTSPSDCTAVGYTYGATSPDGFVEEATLAEVWDGETWTVPTIPDPSGTGSNLLAVSCSATETCTAVGDHVSTDDLGLNLALTEAPPSAGASARKGKRPVLQFPRPRRRAGGSG